MPKTACWTYAKMPLSSKFYRYAKGLFGNSRENRLCFSSKASLTG